MYEVLKVTRTGKESTSVDGFDSLDEDGRDIVITCSVPLKCPWQMFNVKCMVCMEAATLIAGNLV